jgi:hypothetical protein
MYCDSVVDAMIAGWNNNSEIPTPDNKTNNEDVPFERHALETILATVKYLETQEVSTVERDQENLLAYLKVSTLVPFSILENLRLSKNRLYGVSTHVQDIVHALELVVDDEEAMAVMNLSYLYHHPEENRYGQHFLAK